MRKLIVFLFLVMFFVPQIGLAVDTEPAEGGNEKETGEPFPNPLGTEEPSEVIGNVIQAVLGVVGSLALLMFVYGGLTWMLSGGNNERVQKGKNILVWATVGLIVIFASYALVRFVVTGLTGAGG